MSGTRRLRNRRIWICERRSRIGVRCSELPLSNRPRRGILICAGLRRVVRHLAAYRVDTWMFCKHVLREYVVLLS